MPDRELESQSWLEDHDLLPVVQPAARFAVTMIATAPDPVCTLETVRAELLPLAQTLGFVDVRLSHCHSRHGAVLSAAAVSWSDEVTLLAACYESPSLESLRVVALDRLAALTAMPYAGASI